MSTIRLITPQSLTNLQIKLCSKSETFICSSSPGFRLAISKQNNRSRLANDGGLRYRSGGRGSGRGRNGSKDLVVYSDVQPGGAPLPSDPSSNSGKGWILGALVTIMLPFLRNKWGPLFKLTKDVEAMAERAEHVTKVVEEVAEEVDKVAKEVADELPKGGKLEKAIESVENAAEKADKAARVADDLIDKETDCNRKGIAFGAIHISSLALPACCSAPPSNGFGPATPSAFADGCARYTVEEVDKEVESFMEPVNDQAKETTAKEASDQK
ncbi:hypothetical protein RHSIM_Rhsim07G0205400 [Rhododendron simsii]|uniref:Uncharacterized protein n=1 Tax=Rhododendron simsii TaxID=118357 RepID=A0A834GQL1_RHOSS|nr:hypothetical protein RHSIM_Rhsim07G0205400 [Rhododendron simsii]